MKKSIIKVSMLLLVLSIITFFSVPGITAHSEIDSTLVQSPLYGIRVAQAAESLAQSPNITVETYREVGPPGQVSPQVLSLGFSGCIGSGCALSGCAGSACKYSWCFGSACLVSGCFGSACGTSGCAASACLFSGCFGSGCALSGCLGSACLNCPQR